MVIEGLLWSCDEMDGPELQEMKDAIKEGDVSVILLRDLLSRPKK